MDLVSLLMILSLCSSAIPVINAAEDLAKECSSSFQKLTDCLSFAQGTMASPTKQCCTSVQEIKNDDAKCLCYIIQQAHNGGEGVKSLGIKEAKLLQLPTACQIKNANVSACPVVLGLPPNSPDIAFFNGSGATSPVPTNTTGKSTPPQVSSNDKSDGITHGPHLIDSTVVIALTVFLYSIFLIV